MIETWRKADFYLAYPVGYKPKLISTSDKDNPY